MDDNGNYEDYIKQLKDDEDREHRIEINITSLARNEKQEFSAWYRYLKNKMQFPFNGIWKQSSYTEAEKVNVIGILDFDTCLDNYDILVKVELNGKVTEKPLFEIKEVSADEKTKEAIEDWHYWLKSMA